MVMGTVETYLAVRRAAGYALEGQEWTLRSFARYANARGDSHVRSSTAIAWAGQARSLARRAARLKDVVRLARHARAEDPGVLRVRPRGVEEAVRRVEVRAARHDDCGTHPAPGSRGRPSRRDGRILRKKPDARAPSSAAAQGDAPREGGKTTPRAEARGRQRNGEDY